MRTFVTRIAPLVVGAALLGGAPARGEEPAAPQLPDEPKAAATETDKATELLTVAGALVEQARATKSPVAMVAAVQMIRRVRVKDGGGPLGTKATVVGEEKKSDAKKAAKGAIFDTKSLLADAREWAGSDATLLALVDREAARKPEAEGSEKLYGGPACRSGRIGAGQWTYWNLDVIPNTWEQVGVVSDGDCDVDCYAVDQAGRIFRGDNSYSSNCYVSWSTTYGGTFRFVVDNRRCLVYADYRVCAD